MSREITGARTGGPTNDDPWSNDLAVGSLLHLPELSAKDLARATTEESVAWLWGILGRWRPGDMWNDFEGLLTLQKASLDTVRCVRVHDYGGCYWYLSMLRATCSKAGITLDLHMTLVTPLVNGEDAWLDDKFTAEQGRQTPETKQVTAGAKGDSLPPSKGSKDDDDGYNVGMEVA